MAKSRFIELMSKCLDKSASAEELKELEGFLDAHPHLKKVHHVAFALKTGLAPADANLQDEDINSKLDALWVNIKNIENAPQPNEIKIVPIRKYLKRIAGAAAILVIGLVGITLYTRTATEDKIPLAAVDQKIDVPYGQTFKLTLSDGTKVRLNAGSHFGYPATFTGTRRDVTLDGEGFFEVTKDDKKPFLVHTAGLTVKVLGTVFNVRAYKQDKKTETTLFKGKVQIELKGDADRKIVLAPREKLTVLNDAAPANHTVNAPKEVAKLKYELSVLPVVDNDEYQENAWLDNKLVFANTEFEDVAASMERKYKVHIVFKDNALKKEQLSGVLKDENLESALLILKQITSFQSRGAGDTVYISRLNK
ncbi:FecR family protein [Mucilaginibacter glaciei]|uniref:FecR domain-containing protein n=1 Tax=Mucilaginibacter glaciei TaxID=2772109 RepID=A0A926S751_9SPHI|nr:FecR domain-containing protein [Mucilaginibacter glaciei]MBD1394361.1 FecR domain-containing protein [Mucilaginibacter glaciei]